MSDEKTELYDRAEVFKTELLPLIETLTDKCDELGIPNVMTFLITENEKSVDYYTVTAFHRDEDDRYPNVEINYFTLLDTLVWTNGVVTSESTTDN